MRSSPGKALSIPPLKKYVTCAYFSVSAMRRFGTPFSAQTCARISSSLGVGNATGSPNSSLYSVKQTKKSRGAFSLRNS